MGYTPDVSMFPYFANHRDIGEMEDDLEKEMLRNEKLIERINEKIMERKKLEKRLQKFKEMNWKRMDDLVKALSPWKKKHEDHKRILESIQELKEENKELKKDLTDYYTMMTECNKCVPEDWDFGFGIQDKECNPELLDDLDHLPYYLKQITEENEELKEKIICLKSDSYNQVSQAEFDDMQEDLEAEIKKLKEERDFFQLEYHKSLEIYADDSEHYEKEIKKLKEEQFDNMEELAKRDGMCLVDIHLYDKLIQQEEENKQLKEENKKLKAENEYLWEPVNADDYIRLDRQYEELKANYEKTTISNRKAWADNRSLRDIIQKKERQINKLKESL